MALHKSIAEVLAMSGSEILEWQYHFKHEPMVDHFWTTAQICSVIANVMGSSKGKKFSVNDFLPIMAKRKRKI